MRRAPAPDLVNSFPYAMPPAVTLPRPSAGCCRAQPWLAVKRVRDGTGVGEISEEAWWIPTEADAAAEAAAAAVRPGAQLPRLWPLAPRGLQFRCCHVCACPRLAVGLWDC